MFLIYLFFHILENSFRLSQYIYQDISGGLYEPRNFQWSLNASIHVIVPGMLCNLYNFFKSQFCCEKMAVVFYKG